MKIIIKKLLKNIPAALVCFLLIQPQDSKAWDSTAAKFYPLKVGNVYVYHQISLWIQCNPFELRAKKRVTITDYVLKPNGKYYYKFTGWWLTGGQAKPWTYQRVDSNSMNVYAYDSLTNAEFLLDSLLIAQNNSFACKRFNVVTPHATCGSITLKIFLDRTEQSKLLPLHILEASPHITQLPMESDLSDIIHVNSKAENLLD